LVGAGLLLASDLIAQRGVAAIAPQMVFDLPVGIVTALLGAPTLLILIRRPR